MRAHFVVAASAALLVSCKPDVPADTGRSSTEVNVQTLVGAASNTQDWLTTGRTYDEQRFSPLEQINAKNVKSLGLAWYADMDTARGQEATPLVIDGRIYVSTAWSKVKAYDGVSGKLLWDYDPKVPGATAVRACCDVVNRGLAAWGRRLYIGTLDGRLIALGPRHRPAGVDHDDGRPVDPLHHHGRTADYRRPGDYR